MSKAAKAVKLKAVKSVPQTDEQLVEKFRKGCVMSFEELISRYETKAHNLAIHLTRNPEDAEEVLQDVFITVYRKIDSFQGKSKFSSWLYRITVNSAFMKLRKRKHDQHVPLDEAMPVLQQKSLWLHHGYGAQSDSLAINTQIKEALDEAIESLPDEYKAVFVLRDIDGLSNKEVGEILDLTIPAIKSRLHRSRIMLRKKLRKVYIDTKEEKKISSYGPNMMRKAA